MNSIFFITMIIVFLTVTIALAFIPYFTRKTECFGIAVPEKEYANPLLKSCRKQYTVINLVIGVIIFGGCIVWFALSESTSYFATYAVLIQIIVAFFVYLRYHRIVRQLKERSEWKNDVSSTISVDLSSESKEYIPAGWLLLFPAVIIITVVLGFVLYDKIPGSVPIHYDMAGNVNRHAHKSYGLIFFAPLMQLLMAALFTFIFYVVKSRRRRIDPSDEAESRRRGNIFRRSMGIFAIVGGFLMLLSFAFIQLSITEIVSMTASVTVTLVSAALICIFAIVIGVRVGQGGGRVKGSVKVKRDSSGRLNIKDDDSFWKLGMFYFNPDDPSVFVEKRFGVGYTVNFGRPLTYVCIAGLIALIVVITVGAALLTK
jgi:uncharacterized membrane protein